MVESVVRSPAEIVVCSAEKAKLRVLHVDDDSTFLKVAEQCLKMQGPFQVDTAGSVEEAMGKLEKERYDAIVSDYKMPGKDGLQFLKELREQKSQIPFIMLTGKGREEVAVKALNLGADHYVNKNGDPESVYVELAHDIRGAVEKVRSEKMLQKEQQRLFRVLEAIPAFVYLQAPDFSIRFANHEFRKLFGDPAGRKCYEVLRGEREPCKECITCEVCVRKDGFNDQIEWEWTSASGRVFRIYDSAFFDLDDSELTLKMGVDITERKKAELGLQESEKRYRELADQLPVIVYEIDDKGKLTFVNQSGFEIAGYSHEDIEKGVNILQTVADEDREKAKARIQRALSGEKTDYTEYTVLRKDGTTFPAVARVSPIVRGGRVAGLRGTVMDITERKKMEESVRGSEEKFRNLAEQSPNMIFINHKGRVVYANKQAEDVMGYRKEEFYSPDFNFLDMIAPEFKESVKSAFAKHMKGEDDVFPYEYKLITKDGRTIDAIVNSKLMKYGGGSAILGVVTDITDRKKAERMTLESQQSFRGLFMDNPEAAAYLSLDFHIVDVNPRFEGLFGYSVAQIRGRHINDVVVPEDKMEEGEMLDKRALKGYVNYDTVRKRKDGASIQVSVSAAPITGNRGIIGHMVTYRDITERKRYEERLSALNIHSQKLNTAESMEEIYRLTMDAVEKTLGFVTAFLMVVDKDVLRVVDHLGYSASFSCELPLDGTRRGVAVRVVKTGRTVNVVDSEKEDDWVEFMPGIRSGLDVPVKTGHKVLGVIGVNSREVGAFDEKDEQLVEILASHTATAMSNLDRAKNLEAYAREIRESQQKFERLFVNNPEASVYTDSSFRILDINPRFCELFGYSLNEVKGRHIDDVMVPKDKMDEAKMLREEFMKGPIYCDTVRQRKDGTLVPVSISTAPIIVGDQLIGHVGLYKDITERKRYEERLSALNIYSRDLNTAESIEEIYRLTLDAMQKVLGFEYADFFMIDKSVLCIVDQRGYPEPFPLELPLDGSKKGICIKVVKTGNSVIVQDVRKNADFVEGLPSVLSELAVPIRVGQKTFGVLNVESKKLNAFDEKDRALLEILASHAATAISNSEYAKNLEASAREIRESQQRFERLFMDNPEAAVYTDSSFCVLNANPRFIRLFGYSLDEIRGRHINDVVVPEGKMEEARAFDERARKGEAYQEDTVRKRKDGSLVPVAFSAAPIIVENQVVGHMAVYKDISQLKKVEEELRQTLEKLARMNEKLRVIGGLTRHDARNKLGAITGHVYLAKKKLVGNDEVLNNLREIESTVAQMVRIFEFARTYEMLGVEELRFIDVERMVDEAVSLFSDLKGVKAANECHGLTVLADSLLRQLFYNLIDNSLKYGDKIAHIRVHFEESEYWLRLIYEDDGVGISQDAKPRIFSEGYTSGKGSGYGLYLIRKMMEVYGWTIEEAGEPGKGVRFVVTIPKTNGNGKENYRIA